jgi:hypothetical protein
MNYAPARAARVSMTDLFPICVEVLQELRMPVHYKNLTKLAIARLGVPHQKRDLEKHSEDVREKLLSTRRLGTAYIGAPYCYGVMRAWFSNEQRALNFDEVRISGSATAGIKGAYEALMRPMKPRSAAPLEIRNEGKARGLVIEHHVTAWFMRQWPKLVLPPTNDGQWSVWCNHDFRLRIDDKIIRVDVFGPLRDGNYGNPYNKEPADIHLGCRVEDSDILWHSVVSGRHFMGTIIPELAYSPLRMIVWLNCISEGIDYHAIASRI